MVFFFSPVVLDAYILIIRVIFYLDDDDYDDDLKIYSKNLFFKTKWGHV